MEVPVPIDGDSHGNVGQSSSESQAKTIPVPSTTHSAAGPNPLRPTPLPYRKLFAVLSLLINEGIAAGMLFPFVGFYVAFLTGWSTDEAGYASGFLVALFQLGQVLTGKVWGRMADKYGRRPVMLGTQACCCFTVFLFGLAPNFGLALVSRFLHGLVSGSVAIAKVYTTEVTDGTNESKAFVLFPLGWGIGMLIGPFFGGLLYDPANNNHLAWLGATRESLLGRLPALLPCAVASFFTFFGLVISYFAFDETLPKPMPLRALLPRFLLNRLKSSSSNSSPSGSPTAPSAPSGSSTSGQSVTGREDTLKRRGILGGTASSTSSRGKPSQGMEKEMEPIGSASTSQPAPATSAPAPSLQHRDRDETLHAYAEHNVDASGPGQGVSAPAASFTNAVVDALSQDFVPTPDMPQSSSINPGSQDDESMPLNEKPAFGYWHVFGQRSHLRTAVLSYMLISLAEYGLDQVQPLWMIASTARGGMAVNAATVGAVIFVTAVIALPSALFFPFLLSCYGDRVKFFQLSVVVWGFSTVITPFIPMMIRGSSIPGSQGFYLSLVLVSTTLVFRAAANGFAFSTVYMFIAAVGPVEHLGALNGIARSCACACRAVIAIAAPSLFAFSLQHPYPPLLEHYTAFVVLGSVLFSTFFLMLGFKGSR